MLRVTATLLAASLFSASAAAEPLSYDYAYLSHQQTHVNGESFRNDALGAYYQIGANFRSAMPARTAIRPGKTVAPCAAAPAATGCWMRTR